MDITGGDLYEQRIGRIIQRHLDQHSLLGTHPVRHELVLLILHPSYPNECEPLPDERSFLFNCKLVTA
jgi:hypothetical protein